MKFEYVFYPDETKMFKIRELKDDDTKRKVFIDYYKKLYFLNNSIDDEKKIISILKKKVDLTEDEIKHILVWKDKKKFCNDKKTKYEDILSDVNDFKACIKGDLEYNIEKYMNCLNKLVTKDNIGSTYATTLMYFASNGTYPIYDQFAAKAVAALNDKFEYIDYTLPDKPQKRYKEFVEGILEIFSKEYKKREEDILIWRAVDQALWAYGHISVFKKKEN